MVHSARPPAICHSSFVSSGRNGARSAWLASGERKKHILQSGGNARARPELVERALCADAAAGEQHETVAYALGVDELMGERTTVRPAAAIRRNTVIISRVCLRSKP